MFYNRFLQSKITHLFCLTFLFLTCSLIMMPDPAKAG